MFVKQAAWMLAVLAATGAVAQTPPGPPAHNAAAPQAAPQGVPQAELAQGAPDRYTVQRGDTLWAIAGMYLQRPWRWPELWGMNKETIRNPNRIYPGQTLYLQRQNGLARLSTQPVGSSEPPVVRLSPRVRSDSLADLALPTLPPSVVEPFLVEPIVTDADTLSSAPRIIATTEERVIMASGDRAYVRGDPAQPLLREPGDPRRFQIYRGVTPLKDPLSGAVLGYEAQYLGKAELLHGERMEESKNAKGETVAEYVPATVMLSGVKEEIRAGDRLLPAPERVFNSYTPHAPPPGVEARVVSIYGSNTTAMSAAVQKQVISINLGSRDGMEPGQVLQLVTQGQRIVDSTDPHRPTVKLPSEPNGLAMVFRTFDHVSYALILQMQTGVRVGDRLVSPE